MHEINKKVNQLGQNWHEFKTVNDRRLQEVEKKGAADSLTNKYLDKLHEKMDNCEQKIAEMKTAMNRPNLEGKHNDKTWEKSAYDQAFDLYLRKGIEPRLEQKGLSDLNSNDFGYAMSSAMSQQMDLLLTEESPMRSLANISEISADVYEIIDSRYQSSTDWGDKGLQAGDKEESPIANRIVAHPLHCQFTVSQKVANDPRINIEKMVSANTSYSFGKIESEAFINGDGNNKPKGILSYENGKGWDKIERLKTVTSGKLDIDDVLNLLHSLPGLYQPGAKFLMSFKALHSLRTLKDKENRYLLDPHSIEKGCGTLLGLDVVTTETMGDLAKGKLPVAVADFRHAYQIVYRNLATMIVDQVTQKGKNIYFSTVQVGGAVNNFDAIKLLEIS
jgi:HK97 family phage major capsid protein